MTNPQLREFVAERLAARGTNPAPALWFNSWYDVSIGPNMALFNHARSAKGDPEASANQYAVIVPNAHCQFWNLGPDFVSGDRKLGDASFDTTGEVYAFFDRWLKGDKRAFPASTPAVRYFSMGANRWKAAARWPPKEAKKVRFYHRSGGSANSLYGDGRLSTQSPPAGEAPDRYRYAARPPPIAAVDMFPIRMIMPDPNGACERETGMTGSADGGRFAARGFLAALAVTTLWPAAAGAQAGSPPAAAYDIVLKGGRVIDPESGRDEVADVGIRGGAIAAISATALKGKQVLDASGQVVAPGFIDYHAHGQDLASQRYQLLDGVTTAMEMEVGTMPVADFYELKKGRALINYGATASFLCARVEVLSDKRCTTKDGNSSEATTLAPEALTTIASAEQEDRIIQALEREIADGALGVGIGLEYAPAAGRREIYRVFKAAAKRDVPVFVHVRMREPSRAPGMPIAVANELVADAAATGAGLQIAHVTSTALDDTPTVIEILKNAAARGVDVTAEAYPYEAGSTMIGSEFFSEGWQERSGITYGDLQWSETGERLTRETFERYRKEKPSGTVVIFLIPDGAIDAAMADPFVTIASDGMHMDEPKVHPRGAGSFSRVLGHFVRERKLLDLKTALAKMTILPARRLEKSAPAMARKGRLKVGADADIVVFDPATVKDNATYEKPHQASSGYRYILVGGKVMARNGVVTPGLYPGVGIKRGDR